MLTFSHLSSSYFPTLFQLLISIRSYVANNDQMDPIALLLGIEDKSGMANENTTCSAKVVDVEIDCGVASYSSARYMLHYADTLDARRFCAIFLDSLIWFFIS